MDIPTYLFIISLLSYSRSVFFFASTLPFKHSSARISCFSGCSSPYWSYTQCSLTCNFVCPSPTNECIIFTNASRLDHLAPALLISLLNPPHFFNCSSVYNSRSKSWILLNLEYFLATVHPTTTFHWHFWNFEIHVSYIHVTQIWEEQCQNMTRPYSTVQHQGETWLL